MAKMSQALYDLMRFNAALLPKKRSTFDRSHSKATSFDAGFLVPVMVDDILPGDEVKISIDSLIHQMTPIRPVMDSAYIDFFAFFVPDRLVWDNAKAFYGENLDAEYNSLNEYVRPSFSYSSHADTDVMTPQWRPGSLLDYLEMPPLASSSIAQSFSEPVSLLDFRAYQLIWNEWFRASEIQPSINLNKGDSLTLDEAASVFSLRRVNKFHDYFTSLLPRPQGGDSVLLPFTQNAPIVSGSAHGQDLRLGFKPGWNGDDVYPLFHLSRPGNSSGIGDEEEFNVNITSDAILDGVDRHAQELKLVNTFYADVGAFSVNDLRSAITVQQALELDALGGTRYSSLIRSHWGVVTPDDVLQRPELLGQTREIIGMRQQPQTSATSGYSSLGELGAFSNTRLADRLLVDKSFTEYGILMILCCVRPLHTYSQGYTERSRKLSRFDIYLPVFDNIGNQPVKKNTLLAYDENNSKNVPDDEILGYKNAWDEYRTKNNAVTGLMRPGVQGSLGNIWTYADNFCRVPVLSSSFIQEDATNMLRTLSVITEQSGQFIADIYFDFKHTRTMGVSSMPGLKRF